MYQTYQFLNTVLDSVTEHIAVIDTNGFIKYVNNSWKQFGVDNNCEVNSQWIDINYLDVCKEAARKGDSFGQQAVKGIESVIENSLRTFYFEYPCHSPDTKRWFMMRVVPFVLNETKHIIVSHQNITERKLAEDEVCELARIDGLTEIANRRTFNEFLNQEYRRCMRLKKPLTLAIIDVDHFKILNDTYGHQIGDNCLKEVAKVLKKFANRADDICARYGGEEFAFIWGDTSIEQGNTLAQKILQNIEKLQFPNENATTKKYLTVSIGLVCVIPNNDMSTQALIKQADDKLYLAKKNGRNRVEF